MSGSPDRNTEKSEATFINNLTNDSRLKRYAEDFYDVVKSSPSITHLGVFETTDELGRPVVAVYIKEPRILKPFDQAWGTLLSSTFMPLALEFRERSNYVMLELLSDETTNFDHLKRKWTGAVRRYYNVPKELSIKNTWMERLRPLTSKV